MSWHALVDLLQRETDKETADRIEEKILYELAGLRLTIPSKKNRLTDTAIERAMVASGWDVQKAAEKLGVSPSTIYRRRARPRPLPKPRAPDPGPRLGGRIVR